MTVFGLFKSGKLRLRCVINQGNPLYFLGERHASHNQISFIRRLSMMDTAPSVVNEVIPRERSGRPDVDPQREIRPQNFVKQNQNCRWDPDHSWIGWMVKCEKDRNEFQRLQKMEKNILWFAEYSRLYQWNQQYSRQRMTWTFVNPSRTQQISHRNKCSTCLRNWCLSIHGNTCSKLVTKESSIFNARRSTFFQILYCDLGSFRKPSIERCMGQDWEGSTGI